MLITSHYVDIGVLPASQDSHEFVMSQRKEQYDNLRHALDVMRKVDEDTPVPIIFFKMFLIEEGRLPFDEDDMVLYGFLAFADVLRDHRSR